MKFAEIPGLGSIKEKLIRSTLASKMAHAQLFAGKEGALNLPLAIAYATYLHCQNRSGEDACGMCAACVKNDKYIHPDTHFVFPLSNIKNDKDADRFKAEIMKSWRSFLLEQPFGKIDDWTNYYGGENKQALISREESREIIKTLSLKPFESPYKVMIIWLPEFMHPSAANGILKILEEPPPHTFFILVTNAEERLLPTILSRTQIVRVPLLSDDEVNAFLRTHAPEVEGPHLSKVVQLAEGDINLGIKLLDDQDEGVEDQFPRWMRACFKRDYAELVSLAEEFHGLDKLSQRNVLANGLNLMREALLQLSHTELHRTQDDELKFIRDFSKVMDVNKIEKANRFFSDASYFLERNGSPKMTFMNLSIQLARTFNP